MEGILSVYSSSNHRLKRDEEGKYLAAFNMWMDVYKICALHFSLHFSNWNSFFLK